MPSHRPSPPDSSAETYLVPDLLAPGLNLVFCGTAPSVASARARAYYAKPGNRFWPSLHAVGITPRRFAPGDYPELLSLGIGLTDLCKVHSGIDSQLPADAFDTEAFRRKMLHYRPALIAFTSKNAAQAFLRRPAEYGLLDETLGESRLFVLTSPSGLATRFFDIGVWRQLAAELRRLPAADAYRR
ncbi:MAG TPA: mismatch-specific DNA-glycosylase [Usitatibacteraceae bacterium]